MAPTQKQVPADGDPLVGTQMRVWWPPTTNQEKTGYSGAYWPVRVLAKKGPKTYRVVYDNGDKEDVRIENMAPNDPPVGFGEEEQPLQPGEFCEVFNGSRTDPCAYVCMVTKRKRNGDYEVFCPFHDQAYETVEPRLLRRARVLDINGWCLLRPNQTWQEGDILSPHELETIREDDLPKFINMQKKAGLGKRVSNEPVAVTAHITVAASDPNNANRSHRDRTP